MLSQDNTVCIYVTSGPFSFSRVATLKCKGLLNNVLFMTIQEIEHDIRGYFLMKQVSIEDDMHLIIQKVNEINKKLDSQTKVEKIVIIFFTLLFTLLLVYINVFRVLFQLVIDFAFIE
ncbi:hypothetical protein F8M41_011416 [Gigaspora margarita]|uniref:Uncharacterized protein n=1 Tax=Gigaspora margarita TaxID=4874 RepID=A0A8H4A1L6_GIGMA|nr:hypothetical protein F8M41_011416 [Gigaspora margarita]